jgi:AAA+ superfamily predicted ATPase
MKNITPMPLDIKSSHFVGDQKSCENVFNDNLEHLEALEYLAKLYVITSFIRNNGKQFKKSTREHIIADCAAPPPVSGLPVMNLNDLASGNIPVSDILNHVSALKDQINLTVKNSIKKGIHLQFESICTNYQLDEFERRCIILLLANNTSRSFRDIVSRFGDVPADRTWGMSIGSLISIMEPEYRSQIMRRKYFSTDSKLICNNIVVIDSGYDKTRNILDVMVYLHERFVRFILGDNNTYDYGFDCISKEKASIRFNQVILDEKIKEDLLNLSKHFLAIHSSNKSKQFEEFYGYGTGLAFLFYGPSGTGKTMLAHALANELNRELISLKITNLDNYAVSWWDIVAYAFNEAKLYNAIIFFDECDDLLEKNSLGSRSLLIEIEKANCIAILATNKVAELDPSLDRRISMKVKFNLPDEKKREKIWNALIPPSIQISKDVDFSSLSKKYIFTGGLIKNTIFTAITKIISENGKHKPLLTAKDIEQAAAYQTQSMFKDLGEETVYHPERKIEHLPVKLQDKNKLTRMVAASKKLMDLDIGLKAILESPDIQTGIACVEAVAGELDFKIKLVDIGILLEEQKEKDKLLDYIKQSKIHLFEFIFQNSIGQRSIILIKDEKARFKNLLEKNKNNEDPDRIYSELLNAVHRFNGFLFLVTTDLEKYQAPFEFHHYMSIQFPSEEDQIQKWETYIKNNGSKEKVIVDVVERFPLHLNEIDQIAAHAMINAFIENDSGILNIKDVQDVIKKYKQVGKAPLLFGAEKLGKEAV